MAAGHLTRKRVIGSISWQLPTAVEKVTDERIQTEQMVRLLARNQK